MINFEGGYCTRQEYINKEPTRLSETDLRIDELYLVMTALVSTVESESAAKVPAKVNGFSHQTNGLYLVGLSMLDNDLNPVFSTYGMFKGGYWLDVKESVKYGGYNIDNAYIAGYQDSWDDGAHRLYEGLLLDV